MSEKKHTPGEWFTHQEGHSTVYVECRIGGGLIQAVAKCGPTAAGREQQEANARLIAAAPELLEALQEAKAALEWCVEQGGGPTCEHESGGVVCFCKENKAISSARAAIAKATGGQP